MKQVVKYDSSGYVRFQQSISDALQQKYNLQNFTNVSVNLNEQLVFNCAYSNDSQILTNALDNQGFSYTNHNNQITINYTQQRNSFSFLKHQLGFDNNQILELARSRGGLGLGLAQNLQGQLLQQNQQINFNPPQNQQQGNNQFNPTQSNNANNWNGFQKGDGQSIFFYDKNDNFYNGRDYYEFTNFYVCKQQFSVQIGNSTYRTNCSENLFQAAKFLNPDGSKNYNLMSTNPNYQGQTVFDEVLGASTPGEVFRLANSNNGTYKHLIRSDWHNVSGGIMNDIVYAKFTQDQHCQQTLLSTIGLTLVENSPKDPHWGNGPDGKGKNMLGKVLENTRQILISLGLGQNQQMHSNQQNWQQQPNNTNNQQPNYYQPQYSQQNQPQWNNQSNQQQQYNSNQQNWQQQQNNTNNQQPNYYQPQYSQQNQPQWNNQSNQQQQYNSNQQNWQQQQNNTNQQWNHPQYQSIISELSLPQNMQYQGNMSNNTNISPSKTPTPEPCTLKSIGEKIQSTFELKNPPEVSIDKKGLLHFKFESKEDRNTIKDHFKKDKENNPNKIGYKYTNSLMGNELTIEDTKDRNGYGFLRHTLQIDDKSIYDFKKSSEGKNMLIYKDTLERLEKSHGNSKQK